MPIRIDSFSPLIKGTLALLFLSGCYKNHLYVQQEWVDADFLASSKVHTPDPRQAHPPQGQRLLIAWDFPKSVFDRRLTLAATVRFWDNTQTTIVQPIERKRDSIAHFFPNDGQGADRRILTYRVQIFAESGDLVETWNHQFWTELIDVDRHESFSSAHRMSDSVSSQPKQESVTDTP